MRSILKKIFIGAFVVLAVLYIYDYLTVRHRMAAKTQGDPFDTVVHPRLLAIPVKGDRIQYELDAQSPVEYVPCVHSIVPHFGYSPCWYVKRGSKKPIPMLILFPAN
jgi:hypothetical protein